MNPYEVIKAETVEEALEQSKWKVGDVAECVDVRAVGNSDGTWSIFPTFNRLANRSL